MKLPRLFTVCCSVLLFLIGTSLWAQTSQTLSVDEFEKGIENPDIQLLDVRTMKEFQSGHLPNSFLADYNNKEQFEERAKALDKAKPVYVYCLSGGRSSAAAKWLNENGYTTYNLKGGIAAWKQNGKALDTPSDIPQMPKEEYLSITNSEATVLVDFGAEWCPPCKKMEPVLKAIQSEKLPGFKLVNIDGGEQSELMKELKIEALPTFIVYKNGLEVWRKSGIVEKEALLSQIK